MKQTCDTDRKKWKIHSYSDFLMINTNCSGKGLVRIVLLLTFMMLWITVPTISAQKDLQISKVFDYYGKKKGVVMVELTNEMLENYNFTLFKSITIKEDPTAGSYIRSCLSKDEVGAKKIKQVVSNGTPSSIYLQLPKKDKENRLILFNESSHTNQTTLIYIETKSESEEVLKLLLKKK